MTPDFTEPSGLQWGHFQNSKGADIRYAHIKPDGEPKGTVIMVGGLRESSEKYFDAVREMTARGLEVWMMDWRGQGGSERYIKDSQKMHHEGYDEQIATLHDFTQKIVKENDGPLIFMGHSMGAHIGLRYMKEHEGVFDSAILTAPMLDIVTGSLPTPLARQVAKFAKAGNYLDKYIPGGGDWDAAKMTFDKNNKTSDRARFDAWTEFCRHNEFLQMGDPTYGWVYHTFKSIDILQDENYLRSIKTPIFMQTSGDEQIVSKPAQDRAAKLLPNCKRLHIEEAKHEIWQESDAIRDKFLKGVDGFLAERLSPPGAAPKKPKAHMLLRRPKR